MRFSKLFTVFMVAVGMLTSAMAQDRPNVPMRLGAHLGLNYNMTGVGYGEWIEDPNKRRPGGSFLEEVLNDGSGLGLYAGINAQWQVLSFLGIQGRLSYDMRSMQAIDDQSYENVSDEFNFNLGLINLEALAKLYIGDAFHFTGGGGMGFKMADTYTYRLNEQDPESAELTIPGSSIVGSFVGGLGYDIPLSDPNEKQQWFLTPFVEATWMVGMKEVDFESQAGFDDGLSVVTIRAGVGISFGDAERQDEPAVVPDMGKLFRVSPPEDGIYSKRVTNEYFPLRPFVFFNYGSTDIPRDWDGQSRYQLIEASERDEFVTRAKNTVMDAEHAADADANRYLQGQIYYNILNIVGYRLQQTPGSNVTLIGSDPKEKNGDQLAESVKKYLVDSWGIDGGRITTKGQENPRIPSGTARTPAADRPLTEIENRRVEITSEDQSIMRRVVIRAERPAREENMIDVVITTNESIDSWQATISGNGQRKSYGPFTDLEAYLDPTGLLGEDDSSEEFTVEVVAKTKDGRTLSDTEKFELFLNKKDAMAERHVLTFEYAEEDPVSRSQAFINDIAKRIPNGATVIVSGYTDNIGNEDVNQKLSLQRAREVEKIIEDQVRAAGKKADVRAFGYGEASDRHPYPNERPEGRMYNRTVIVDILP